MKYFRVSTFITINALVFYLIWVSIVSNPLMVHDPDIQNTSQTLSSDPISFSITSPNARTPIESTIIPKTNMTVSQYISGRGNVKTLELQLQSLNTTHWFTRADYQNVDSIDPPFDSPFESEINRDSTNHFYNSTNYWGWEGETSDVFDFWIDPTNFSKDYKFSYPSAGNFNITVHNLENITLDGVGTFEAWNMSVDFSNLPNFFYYEKNTGMFLSSYLRIVSDIWYNLTSLETASLPDDYKGPILSSASPSNETLLASGSLITLELTSPFGIDTIYYNWDEQTNFSTSSYIETAIPASGGLHNLSLFAYDNVGHFTSYFLVYETDISLAGVILNSPRNDSRVQGESQIELTVVSGNGTMFINWDNSEDNTSIPIIEDKVVLEIPNQTLELSHMLTVYVNNSDDVWTRAKYVFFVDNTIPLLTLDNFENNSVQKGAFSITLSVSEDSNITYSLNGGVYLCFLLEKPENESLTVNTPNNKLSNGTHNMHLEIRDEAGNLNSLILTFDIYTSDFNWNWDLTAEETRSLDFYDVNNTFWFTCSVVSRSNQFFNFSLLTDTSSPILPENSILGLRFQCEVPTDIIFLTLIFPLAEQLNNFNETFSLYDWVVWDNEEWVETTTSYDQVSHAWKTTNLGYSQYFALIDSGEKTQIKSVVVGGGSIPAFELPTILFSICVVVIFKKVKNKCQ